MRSQCVVVSICPVVGLILLLAACGGSDIAGTSPRAAASRQGGTALAAPTYVPAPQTCAAMPGPAKIAPSPIASATTHVSGYRVCGPFTATTRLSSFDCPRPSTASGPFRLLVYNGRPDGTGRVSEAEITINGRRILEEDAFDEHVASAAARVELAASNQIVVVLHDLGDDHGSNHGGEHAADGGSDHSGENDEELPRPGPPELRLEIADEGQTCFAMQPATVTRATPLDRRFARLNAFPMPEFQLFPILDDEGHEEVKKGQLSLNGVALIGKHDLREKTSAILKPVSLSASNRMIASVREGSFIAQIVDRDNTPPQFTIALPPDGSFTNKPQLPLSGSIDDPSATLTVNGALATLAGGGYTGQAGLAECWNTITVAAADVCTNASSAQVRVGLDTVPPVLAINGPPNGLVTNQPGQLVSLRFSDNFSGIDLPSLQVSLDGQDIRPSLAVSADAATGSLTLPEGRHVLHAQVSDRAGNVTAKDSSFIVDLTPPVLAITAPKDGSSTSQSSIAVSIGYTDALSGVDQTSFAASLDGQDVTTSFTVGPASATATLTLPTGRHQLDVQIADLAANVARSRSVFTIANALPPDPRTVAPPLNRTVATSLVDATAFLYSGPNPIQVGVAPGTIEGRRVAVIRGKVRTRATPTVPAVPIPGVHISILGHPELGSTLSRADGVFDLAVNGGGSMTLAYAKDGYLPAHRLLETVWREFTLAPDVALIPYDPSNPLVTPVTRIQSGAPNAQVAVGPAVTDAAGSRTAKIVFPAATRGTAILSDGTRIPLDAMTVSATEYTVGADGQAAMAATLPPTSQYTYAVDLRVDEAVRLGAERVAFDKPVYFYLENYLGFPVGTNVPSGYYDFRQAAWVASDNGVILKILGVNNGQALVDVDGSGTAAPFDATLAGLGFTQEELRILAAYPVGQALWRVPLKHFSFEDFNWGIPSVLISSDAVDPDATRAKPVPVQDKPCKNPGCIIETQNQILGDAIPLTGTPYALHYQSDRTPGFKDQLRIPLSSAKVPPSMTKIKLSVQVAGRDFAYTFKPLPNQTFIFGADWDGMDVYGRAAQGRQPALVTLSYCYPILYSGTGRFASYRSGGSFWAARGDWDFCIDSKFHTQVSIWDEAPTGLGGWSITPHHAYDPVGRVLYKGDGTRRSADALPKVITTAAGNGPRSSGFHGEGGPAVAASLNVPTAAIQAPDGSLYIGANSAVLKVTPDGIIHRFAGTGQWDYSGDGGPALAASFRSPWDLALGRDGSLYIADSTYCVVRKVDPRGIITTVAGSYQGSPYWNCRIAMFVDDADDSLYLGGWTLRRITPDGVVEDVAPLPFSDWDGLKSIGKGPGGTIYAAIGAYIARLNRDGKWTFIGGNGDFNYSGDGGPARSLGMSPMKVAVAADGTVVFSDWGNSCLVRAIRPDGILYPLTGRGSKQEAADGIPAIDSSDYYTCPLGVSFGVDGNIYVASGDRVRKIGPSLPAYSSTDFFVASEDGSEVYFFDGSGRHQRTLDALTGAVRVTFGYDADGRLSSVTDAFSNVLTIDRDSAGAPLAITSPFGVKTRLALGAGGYLAQVTNPANETQSLSYAPGGLLTNRTDAKGFVHSYTFDAFGRLTSDLDPAGGSKTLVGAATDTDRSVTLATALTATSSYSTTFATHTNTDGSSLETNTLPSMLTSTTVTGSNRSESTTTPDGMSSYLQFLPDPRFGLNVPLQSSTIRTPSGITSSTSQQRSVTLGNPADPLSVTSLTDTTYLNGRAFTASYSATASGRTMTLQSPAGRKSVATLDAFGRTTQLALPGLSPIQYSYDARGRLASTTQGSRTTSIQYDANGYVSALIDPLSRQVGFVRDPAGRPLAMSMPDGRTVQMSYDANGNVSSVTPPGRPAHAFAYTPVDLEQSYSPPNLGFASTTSSSYMLDQQLSSISRPGGDVISTAYDGAGRLASLTTSWGTTSYSYSPATGRLVQITAPDLGKLSYSYDGALLTDTSWSGDIAGTVHRSYDNLFRVASESISGGPAVSYQYDADGLLTSAGALQFQSDPATGFATGSALGATTESRTYDAYGAEASYTASFGGSNLYSVSYTRDALGRIASKTERIGAEAAHTFGYVYDVAGRLTDVSKDGVPTAHYAYDANGNRLAAPGLTSTPAYDAQDRLLSYGACSYSYKPGGELQSKTCPDGITTYDYDAFGNLRGVTLSNGKRISYVIDGQNRRVGRKVNNVLVEGFLYRNQLRPAAWLNGDGSIRATFVYGLHVNVPEYMVQGGVNYRLVTDQVGSVRLVVNTSTGTAVERIDYDEFGNVVGDSAPGFQPFGFAGGLRDMDTALVRFGARDYDPVIGRWTAKDPLRFGAG